MSLADVFKRPITYLRVSVTDRCDLRCRYCMAEEMTFLPRDELLSIEELGRICEAFIKRGVTKIRLTGGEPLARAGVLDLACYLSRFLEGGGLGELTMTTNGSRLSSTAGALARAGMKRVNVSLDTLDSERFRAITRWGQLGKTMEGIRAAQNAGLKIKINMVIQKGVNDDEVVDMLAWCMREGHDLTLIETMPLGAVGEDRAARFVSLSALKQDLERVFPLSPSSMHTGGPARYFDVTGAGIRLGFITPMSHNFCEACNRVRLAADGKLYMCLGAEDYVDLREACRSSDEKLLDAAIAAALQIKPERHMFSYAADDIAGAIPRHMNVTGG